MSSKSGPGLAVSRFVGHVEIGSESNTEMFSYRRHLGREKLPHEDRPPCTQRSYRRTRGVTLSNLIRVACLSYDGNLIVVKVSWSSDVDMFYRTELRSNQVDIV